VRPEVVHRSRGDPDVTLDCHAHAHWPTRKRKNWRKDKGDGPTKTIVMWALSPNNRKAQVRVEAIPDAAEQHKDQSLP